MVRMPFRRLMQNNKIIDIHKNKSNFRTDKKYNENIP